jgi:hypothetical protein
MTTGEALYLALVITAAPAFSVTLAWVSWHVGPESRSDDK